MPFSLDSSGNPSADVMLKVLNKSEQAAHHQSEDMRNRTVNQQSVPFKQMVAWVHDVWHLNLMMIGLVPC